MNYEIVYEKIRDWRKNNIEKYEVNKDDEMTCFQYLRDIGERLDKINKKGGMEEMEIEELEESLLTISWAVGELYGSIDRYKADVYQFLEKWKRLCIENKNIK